MQKNAKQQLQSACTQLSIVQNSLNQAMDTVEKPNNKQQIKNALYAINNAIDVANTAWQNYQD